MDWHVGTVTTSTGGRFQLVITGRGKSGAPADVTVLRGAVTQIQSYADADPFGDATAELTFPALTPFDDLDATDLHTWLMEGASVDIYWRPAIKASTAGYPGYRRILDPLTDQGDIITPEGIHNSAGHYLRANRRKVWEGYIASIKATADETSFGLPVTCQGALFQVDRYRAAPFYPPDPWPMEALMVGQFSTASRPQLRTRNLIVCYPTGWARKIPKYVAYGGTPVTPHGRPGDLYSGLATRNTGSWNPALTGFCQDLLTVMITRRGDGARSGNQWTIGHYRANQTLPDGVNAKGKRLYRSGTLSGGRQPVLQVRNRYAAANFAVWLGAPGVSVDLDRDSTQAVDVIYGDGIDIDGQTWRNAAVNDNTTRTSYLPLAADQSVYPYKERGRNTDVMPLEGYTKYGNGFSVEDGISIAEQQLAFNMTPGWQGTITMKTDPSPTLSRWEIHSGMVVLLRGFMGSGEGGMKFHIASCTHAPEQGSITMTVDTRFRDLLTVEESLQRTRDPLTPVKMLQVNQSSTLIEDVQAPWDYNAGSGFIPTKSRKFFKLKPNSDQFPWTVSTHRYPPSVYGDFYVGPVHAAAKTSSGRWYGPVPVITSAKDTIARTEFVCVDFYGRPKRIPFHVSFYYVNVKVWSMPHLHGSYSPYQLNAFEKVDPVTGTRVNPLLWPNDKFIIGWGNNSPTLSHPTGQMDRPGFWPGRETSGTRPTGRFVDDFVWDYDLTSQRQYFEAANPPGKHWKDTDVSLYAMFYAEANESVYFIGRLFRQNPGAT